MSTYYTENANERCIHCNLLESEHVENSACPHEPDEKPVAWRMPYEGSDGWLFSETAPNDPEPDRSRWEALYTRPAKNKAAK
jgi:hypothetical protein